MARWCEQLYCTDILALRPLSISVCGKIGTGGRGRTARELIVAEGKAGEFMHSWGQSTEPCGSPFQLAETRSEQWEPCLEQAHHVSLDHDPVVLIWSSSICCLQVGLYFSAGWCPPCRAFSPRLAEFAKCHADDLVVVFVSSDYSEQEMKAYVRHALTRQSPGT